ncbi:hypothetical protein ACE5IS_18140 [Leptospira wolffii]|uniref:Uncharacterized protein n=1 Tax=Leptospira wolffii TaxID=409998 RepID=A0ABV5BVW3_9LEPT
MKLKEPSQLEHIHPDSKKYRFSARLKPGVYYDPKTGKTGTRTEYGHMDMDPR